MERLKGSFKVNVALFTFFTVAASSYSQKVDKENRPNILLILSDDHSFPYLGCYGDSNIKTPNLDRIAKEGIRFNRAYTTAPQSVPSRASIMTGRNVLDIQMLRFSAPLNKNIITGPELLRAHGYYTGICGRNYHLDGSGNGPKESEEVFDKYNLRTFHKRVDYLKIDDNDETNIQQFKEFLNQVPQNKLFFLQMSLSDPHRPFTAENYNPDYKTIKVPYKFPDTEMLRQDLSTFYGEVQRLDHSIGLLLHELEIKGFLNNTLIVFMGDNGSALLRGKGTLYEGGIHVPLLARWPDIIKPGSVSDLLVSGEDLVPTFLDIAGIECTKEMTGQSFFSTLHGEKTDKREYIYAVRGSHGVSLPNKGSGGFDLSRAVMNEKFKLIYNPLFYLYYSPIDFGNSSFWRDLIEKNNQGLLEKRFSKTTMFTSERPLFELFDLENDPDEFNNLAGIKEYKEIEDELKKELQKWMIIYRDIVPLPILSDKK